MGREGGPVAGGPAGWLHLAQGEAGRGRRGQQLPGPVNSPHPLHQYPKTESVISDVEPVEHVFLTGF